MGNLECIGSGTIEILCFAFQSITRNLWRKRGNYFRRKYDFFMRVISAKSNDLASSRIASSSSKKSWFSHPIFCTHSRYWVKPFERMRPLLPFKCGILIVSLRNVARDDGCVNTLSLVFSLRRDQWIARIDLSCRSFPWFRLSLTTNLLWQTDCNFFQDLLFQTVRKIFVDPMFFIVVAVCGINGPLLIHQPF
jgi:hypothetical protein